MQDAFPVEKMVRLCRECYGAMLPIIMETDGSNDLITFACEKCGDVKEGWRYRYPGEKNGNA